MIEVSRVAEMQAEAFDSKRALNELLKTVVSLYSDKTHFFHELIQNAEDAHASAMKFVLKEDCLELYHDGIPFTAKDLISICDVRNSTKILNDESIGKFGLGFKAVYGICDTVTITSSAENYKGQTADHLSFTAQIKDYISAEDLQYEALPFPYTTKFVLPFAYGDDQHCFKTIDDLKKTLSQRLLSLGANTLLFLKHVGTIICIDEINKEERLFSLKKKVINNDICSIVTPVEGSGKAESSTIRYVEFSKEYKGIPGRVDIAFKQVLKGKQWHFSPISNADIYVYFPTGTKSGLDFIVNGRFSTTPNREHVKEPTKGSDNERIIEGLSRLLIEAVTFVAKNMPKEYVSLIPILPLKPVNEYVDYRDEWDDERDFTDDIEELYDNSNSLDKFWYTTYKKFREVFNPWMFGKLYAKLWLTFEQSRLIPTADGSKSKISESILINEPLAKLFTDEQLTSLIGHDVHKVNQSLTNNHTVMSYFRNYHRMEYYDDSKFSEFKFTSEFFEKQSEKWYFSFLDYISHLTQLFPSLTRMNNPDNFSAPANLYLDPFVKTVTGKFKAPYSVEIDETNWRRPEIYKPAIYLPSTCIESGLDFVDIDIYERYKDFFLDTLHLIELNDIESGFLHLEEKYGNKNEINRNTALVDLKWLLQKSSSIGLDRCKNFLKSHCFIRAISTSDKKLYYVKSEAIFLPVSDEKCQVVDYFALSPNEHFILDVDYYKENKVNINRLAELGDMQSQIGENLYRYSTTIFTFVDLEDIHKQISESFKTKKRSVLIRWSKEYLRLLGYYTKKLTANSTFWRDSYSVAHCLEIFGDVTWLYTQDGTWEQPDSIFRSQINEVYDDIGISNTLCTILGIKDDPHLSEELEKTLSRLSISEKKKLVKDLSKELGYTWEPSTVAEKNKKDNSATQNISFDDDSEDYYDARSNKFEERYDLSLLCNKDLKVADKIKTTKDAYERASNVIYERREINIRTSINRNDIRNYLGSTYSTGNGCVCQCCGKVIRNFVSTQIEESPEKEIPQEYLCLCYDCSHDFNLFREVNTKQYENFLEKIRKYDINKLDVFKPVEIAVNGDKKISFLPEHFLICYVALNGGKVKIELPKVNGMTVYDNPFDLSWRFKKR